ncbi:hypothetical protein U3516DRAFT_767075 [Neocallimastix sp. 'constans']
MEMTIVFQRKGTYGNLLIAFTWSNFVVNIIIYDTINDYCSVEKGCQYEIGSYYYQLMINIFSVIVVSQYGSYDKTETLLFDC